MNNSSARLAANLRHLRLLNAFTQDTVGQMIGCTRYAICKYESGQRSPGAAQLRRLSKVYRVTIDDLINADLSGVFTTSPKKESTNG